MSVKREIKAGDFVKFTNQYGNLAVDEVMEIRPIKEFTGVHVILRNGWCYSEQIIESRPPQGEHHG